MISSVWLFLIFIDDVTRSNIATKTEFEFLELQAIHDEPYMIRQRQSAWKDQDMVKYRALRNLVQRTANKLRSKYYSRCVTSLRNAGPRQWWSAVKRITGQSRE